MNKAVIIGIIVVGIIVGFLAISSFDSFSILKDEKSPILVNEEESKDQKPEGRNLTLEFNEKMGFTDP